MSEETKKADTIGEKITFTVEQVTKILRSLTPYYGMFKFGARLFGQKIPPEIDEIIDAINKGETPDLTKLQDLGDRLSAEQPKVGETVMTWQLAEQAWFLHNKEGMGTRAIADLFTKEGSPCSHATVARWINMYDMQLKASKKGAILQVLKYAGIIGAIIASLLLGKFLL